MSENEISKVIVDAAIEVHRELGGPGLLEDIYEGAMEEELRSRKIIVERQLPVRLTYKGRVLRKPLRLDTKVGVWCWWTTKRSPNGIRFTKRKC
jgi:GxxExxY protein